MRTPEQALSLPPEGLAADLDRLRGLARTLLRDAASADDVVQEAVAEALAGDGGRRGRGWLRSAVRSRSVDLVRSERARSRREREVARGRGTAPSAAETVERAELARELYGAVLDLPDAMRDAVLLRFMDDLPPREIAERVGGSVPTVKKRIERGLDRLRASLEQRHGGRGQWAVALLPLAGREGLEVSAVSGMVAGSAALVAMAVIGGVSLLVWRGSPPPTDGALERLGGARAAEPSGEEVQSVVRTERGREVLVASEAQGMEEAAEEGATAAEDFALVPFEATFVDATAQPIPGLELEWTGPQRGAELGRFFDTAPTRPLRLTTDAFGRIRSDRIPLGVSTAEDFIPVARDRAIVQMGTTTDGQVVGVVTPAVRLAGVVVDGAGVPVGDARVAVKASVAAMTSLELELAITMYLSDEKPWTGEDGAFQIERAPSHPDFEIAVERQGAGYSESYGVPAQDDLSMRLQAPRSSNRPEPKPSVVHGRVFLSDGRPSVGATVSAGDLQTKTDETGSYRLSGSFDGGALRASLRSKLFVNGPVPDAEAAKTDAGAGPYDLRLPTRMERLRAQLVSPEGRPLHGLHVFLVDANSVGRSSQTLERPVRRTDSLSVATESDTRGIFGFDRVEARPYLVRVFDPATQLVQTFEGVDPEGRMHRLVFEPEAHSRALAGIVRDVHGVPVKGAEVRVRILTRVGGTDRFSMSQSGVETTTEEEGRFRLEGVPAGGARLEVDEPSLERTSFGPLYSADVGDLGDELTITVDRWCELVVTSDRSQELFDRVGFAGADGERLLVTSISADMRGHFKDARRRANGTFPLLRVPQSATELILLKGRDREVERLPVRPDPALRQTVRVP